MIKTKPAKEDPSHLSWEERRWKSNSEEGGSKAPRARTMAREGEAGEPAEGCAFPRSVAHTRVCSKSGSCDSAAKSRRYIFCDGAGKGRQEKTGDFGGRTHVLRDIIPRGGGRALSLSAPLPGALLPKGKRSEAALMGGNGGDPPCLASVSCPAQAPLPGVG